MNPLVTLLTLSLATAASVIAAPIEIDSTNFSRVGGGTVANQYTASNHVALQYIPGSDYLSGDYRFTLTFDFTSSGALPGGGVGVWFGEASAANWVFVNEEFGGATDQLRNFTVRNLTNNTNGTGNAITTANITDSKLFAGSPFTLTVDRQFRSGGYKLDIEARNATTSELIASLSNISVAATTTWGVSIYAALTNGAVSTETTTRISSLDLQAIPEPSTLGALLVGGSLLFALRRCAKSS